MELEEESGFGGWKKQALLRETDKLLESCFHHSWDTWVPDLHINWFLLFPFLIPRVVRHFKNGRAYVLCCSKKGKQRDHRPRPCLLRTTSSPTAVPHSVDLPGAGQPERSLWKVTQRKLYKEIFCLGMAWGACFITNPSISVIPQVVDIF